MLVLKFAADNWFVVLIGFAFIALLAVGYCRKIRERDVLKGVGYYAGSAILFLVAVGLCIGGVRGGFTKMTRPITMSNATLYTANNLRATMILSNPFCLLRTMGSSGKISYKKYFPKEELNAIYTPEHYPAAKSSKAELEGRNVVVFVLESFSAEHSALLRPDLYKDKEQKGYTPHLDSLMRHSYTFSNMYANGRRSIQALPAVWASIPSYKNPFVLMPQSMAETRALPAILKDRGYRTMFFCGSDHGSMGFGAFARSTGIEHLYSRQDYEKAHGKGDFDGYWGIWDEKFIGYMGEQLQQTQEPFFASIFTLTSHHPFVIPEEYKGKLPEGLTLNHKCVAYVDQAIGKFFARHKDQEWFRNTIFVFVADHVSSETFSEEFRSAPGSYQVIGFIHAPESSLTGEHRQVVSQVDIMPTLLGLLGNEEPYFAFGRDIFNECDSEPMSVSYANNQFQAITSKHLILFDEKQIIAVYANNDFKHEHNLLGQVDVSAVEKRLKAMIQSYYSRIETKDYLIQK
jgi:phosphoglycerol transferase MdoB-like AlkP superfamily enzyme